MPGRPLPIKLLQLKLPVYTTRALPGRFERWLAGVVNLNEKKDHSLLTELEIKRAWTDTIRAHSQENRLDEMHSKAGKSAMLSAISKAQLTDQRRASAIKNSRGRWQAPSVLKDFDISDYKIPSIGTKHLEAVRYSPFAKQVQQANIGKPFNQEVVDTCFWSMVDELRRKKVCTKALANGLLNQAKSVMTQADTYWSSLEPAESVPERGQRPQSK